MKLIFIRHFSTAGNEKRQYIGRTDEAITEQARKIYLREPFHYPDVRQVVASPMRRCVQTAKLLYPKKKIWTQELLRECDFGEFEYRNYEELKELLDRMLADEVFLRETGTNAGYYVTSNAGATDKILSMINF